ncbi:hypothetical protein [Actinoplanes sp. L3-i22]|uniref:hypothetical protein n=1 Tax=Actinoplanes sp. L3-i22 TaxID=2836373 RepID=UPI001C794F79|nr:hypothetical protein [Actinoplanes sp. L3-i22]BCY12701.1 hypothetical protein L3i22_077890 [Actinoplanes sp. L3-i22]
MANRFQLWGQAGWASAEVVGETHYAKSIRALFGNDFNPQGTDITIPVQLMPDRSNRHDRNAVGVWADTALLGHLPRPEAARYIGVLTTLAKRNLIPEVNAQIHGREWGEYDGRPPAFVGTIRLDLAEPHMIMPANNPPAHEHRLLPTGSALQVNGQEQHPDALAPYQRPEGECWAYVTLHEMADHLVEVRLGDGRVGDLSPKMSFELTPILRYQAERGLVVAARAVVKSNANKTEVLLYVARVQDLPESWTGPAARSAAASGRVAPVSPSAATAPVTSAATTPVTPAATSPMMPAAAGPELPAAGTSAVPSWMSASDAVPSWASTPSDAQPTWMDRSELVPTWVQPSGPVPSWAASVSGPVPTIAGRPQADDPGTPTSGVPTSSVSGPSGPGLSTGPIPGMSSGSNPGMTTGPISGVSSGSSHGMSTGSNPGLSTGPIPGMSTGPVSGGSSGFVPGVAAHPIPGVPTAPLPGSISGIPVSPAAPIAGSASAGLFGGNGSTGSFGVDGQSTGSFSVDGRSTGSTGSFGADGRSTGSTGSFGADPASGSFGRAGSSTGSFSSTGSPAGADSSSGSFGADSSSASFGAGSSTGSFSSVGSPAGSFNGAGSPVGLFGGSGEIAETTVIPALSAVVMNKHAATASGSAPVSPAPEANRHPAIPSAPTGIKFVVPPGWPTPPDGWYPPEGWQPDVSWPLAPIGWQWWVPTWD